MSPHLAKEENSFTLPDWSFYASLGIGALFLFAAINNLLPFIAFGILVAFFYRQSGKVIINKGQFFNP